MSPSPKFPREKTHIDDNHSSNDDLSHPSFHIEHEYIASTDESTTNSDDDNDNRNQLNENLNGYCLLSQESNPNQQQNIDNDDDEFLRFATLRIQSSMNENQITNPTISTNEFIWSTKLQCESFQFDDDKANYIKNLMSKVKLPESSIPIWAQYYSEQVWQEKLRERITCRQTTFFPNENN